LGGGLLGSLRSVLGECVSPGVEVTVDVGELDRCVAPQQVFGLLVEGPEGLTL
jgi:hypothetical protein